jgi:hypothetical protein
LPSHGNQVAGLPPHGNGNQVAATAAFLVGVGRVAHPHVGRGCSAGADHDGEALA